MSIITLTTDFGTGSPYAAAMKGAVLAINPNVTLVDLTHDVPAQDVRHGAMVLADTAGLFPDETIHVAVVDPGVGTERAIVYARIGRQHFIAPDNGLLSRLVAQTHPSKIVRINNPDYWRDEVSSTFQGRDIMAPAAAHLSLGVEPDDLGVPAELMAQLEWAEVRQLPRRLEGIVMAVDSFGNLITNITAEMIGSRPTDERGCVVCSIYETWGIYRTYGEQLCGTLVSVIGSTGHLEIAVVEDNAAERLGIQVGMPVVVSWE